jgi:hypothetical protein
MVTAPRTPEKGTEMMQANAAGTREQAGPPVGSRDEPKNLDHAKNAIRAYFGEVRGEDGTFRFSEDSAWHHDVETVVGSAEAWIRDRASTGEDDRLALVLDVDDTSLSNYPYLARTGFGDRRNREVLPAIGPVRDLAVLAHELTITLFFISERTTARLEETTENLSAVGFPSARDCFFRPASPPYPPFLLDPACRPAVFKTAAREFIESQGFVVVASVGDQESDVVGGHRERAFKLPNPMYEVP